jgi:magnesium-transporting ATPase (P-type)
MQGRIRKATAQEAKETPLQEKLEDMVKKIGYFGMGVAVLTVIALMIKLAAGVEEAKAMGTGKWILEAFIIAITIIVVAISEGLPLAVTISLAYSTMKMMRDNNLVRVLAACETMGNATDICSDKTGTLTQNRMTVVEFWAPPSKRVELRELEPAVAATSRATSRIFPLLPTKTAEMFIEHACLNTTAFISESKDEKKRAAGLKEVTGSKTAGAGLFSPLLAGLTSMNFVRMRTQKAVCLSITSSPPSVSWLLLWYACLKMTPLVLLHVFTLPVPLSMCLRAA